jgi:mannan endo-1,4-beta-mannosidase
LSPQRGSWPRRCFVEEIVWPTSTKGWKRTFAGSIFGALCVAGCGGNVTAEQSPGQGGAAGSGGGAVADAGGVDAAPAGPPTYTLTLSTADTRQYLSSGTGGVLDAAANSAGASETFTLTDVNGGALSDGDVVVVYWAVGGKYLSAANGGGGALAFSAATVGDDETFMITRIAGAGTIAAGDSVALQTKVTGNYVSAINGGGGDVLANAPWAKAWETYTLALPSTSTGGGSDGGGTTAGGGGTSARDKVLAYLKSIQGKQSAIGIEDKDASNPTADSDTMSSIGGTGGYPSFWSGDWGFGSDLPDARESIVKAGEAQWAKGAIVQYIYHACPLTMGADENCAYEGGADGTNIKGSSLTDAQWSDLITPGGALNKVWLARLDLIAGYFAELKAAGVAPLFRPLHEINASTANNGLWAWWQGRPGPNGSPKLYQITHDYLVNSKGLDNIIWVYNVQDYTTLADDVGNYSPGASYFDIAALDVYNTGFTTQNYQAMVGIAAGKPIGVAECYTLMNPSLLTNQPLWTYVAMWPDEVTSSANASVIPALFQDTQVVKLAQMPGWN